MEITSTHQAQNQPVKAKQSMLGGDFTTFLNMLTVQLKNQDPLNPMESSEFAVQLATFSSVEQQVRSNDLLAEIASQNGGGLASYSDLIGQTVRVDGHLHHGAKPVELGLPGHATAETATLIVKRADGTIASTKVIDPLATQFRWEPEGNTSLAAGSYSVSVRYAKDGEELATLAPSATSRVVEISAVNGAIELVLENGLRMSPDEISGLAL